MINYKVAEKKSQTTVREFIVFSLKDTEYAIDVLKVQEIALCEKIISMPNLPPYIQGVKKLQGEMVPIMDLCQLFNMTPPAYNAHTLMILLKFNSRSFGIIVTEVKEITVLEVEPSIGDGKSVLQIAHTYISELAKLAERIIPVIDVEVLYQHAILNLAVK